LISRGILRFGFLGHRLDRMLGEFEEILQCLEVQVRHPVLASLLEEGDGFVEDLENRDTSHFSRTLAEDPR